MKRRHTEEQTIGILHGQEVCCYATPGDFESSFQGHAPEVMTISARNGQRQHPGLSG